MKGLIRKVVVVNFPPKADNLGGNLIMKRLVGLVLGLFLVAGITGMVVAAGSDNIKVYCSINAPLSVAVSTQTALPDPLKLGALSVNSITITASSITVTNDSSGRTQKYNLAASNAIGGTQDWTLAASTGSDTYAMQAVFNGGESAPVLGDFSASDYLSTGGDDCDGTKFAGLEDGLNVVAGAVQSLYLLIRTPSSVKDVSEHTITLTVTAVTY